MNKTAIRMMAVTIIMLALALILFPVNTHFAIYGTYTSSLVWVLIGLWAAAWKR